MPDLADEFAVWVIHNAIEGLLLYPYCSYRDQVRFTFRLAIKEWVRERDLYNFPHPTPVELKRLLRRKPYWLQERTEGPTRIHMFGINILKCYEMGFDIPQELRVYWKGAE